MRTPVTITDLTRMQGDHICVAGYLRDGTCIRPIFRHGPLTESWVWQKNTVIIRPFMEVELELLQHKPDPPHSEDWWVVPTYYRMIRFLIKPELRLSLLAKIEDPNVASIFGAPIRQQNGWFIDAGQGNRSLGTVKVDVGKVTYKLTENGRWDYRIAFKDASGTEYRLAVTDLAFRCYLEHARLVRNTPPDKAADHLTTLFEESTVYLRIGLARGWAKYPDRCHLQITGVYSFPDYLDGKCFADFQQSSPKPANDIKVPF